VRTQSVEIMHVVPTEDSATHVAFWQVTPSAVLHT
jgi:hypothetical protein